MKISIITPNYNYAHFIPKLIESVQEQSYGNIEHIIVDDGSTDNSVEVIKSYQKKYQKKIKLIQQVNKGQSNALNTALKEVTGDIIAWINSDDYYYSNDVFELVINAFNRNEKLDAVKGNISIIDQNYNIIREKKYFRFNYKEGVFIGFGRILSSNSIFWRNYISENIYFNENYTYSMDADYFSRILFDKNILHIDKTLATFMWHDNAKTIKLKNDDKLKDEAKIQRALTIRNAYNKLKLSRYFSPRYIFIFQIYYKVKRTILKIIKGYAKYK